VTRVRTSDSKPPAWALLVLRLVLPARDREFYLGDLEEGGRRPWLREVVGAFALRFGRAGARAPRADSGIRRSGSSAWRRVTGPVVSDLRFGMRRLLRTPGATSAAFVALSLGIGLSALMFSLIDGALLPVLPFPAGERIVKVQHVDLEPVSVATYEQWRERQSSFEGLGASVERSVNLTIEGRGSELAIGAAMGTDVLALLAVQPLLGRPLTEADAAPGAPAVVLVGHETWQRRFDADPGVLGQTVRVNGEPAEIIGVMPEGFGFPRHQELWMPLHLDALRPERNPEAGLWVFGVLREGVPPDVAAAELSAIELQLPRATPAAEPTPIQVTAYTDIINPRGRSQQLALTMLGVALLVLLVACANATNVLLARAAVRGREVAVRAALGASRVRIATQFWAEVSILALAGALGGVVLAGIGLRLVRNAVPENDVMPFWFDFRIDLPVLVFVAAAAVLAAMLAGVAPALHATRGNRPDLLNDASRGTSSGRLGKVMGRLIGTEMAVSFVLLVAAGLLVRSAVNLREYDFPFEPGGVYTSMIRLPDGRYDDAAARVALVERLEQELAAMPDATSFTLATALPGTASAERGSFALEGVDDPAGMDLPETRHIAATPGYFETFRAAPLSGRVFDGRDGAGSPPVAIVNRTFERTWLPAGAVGRRIALPAGDGDPVWLTIVGVVPDLLTGGLEHELETAVYRPLAQDPPARLVLAARSRTAAAALAEPVREVVVTADPDLVLFQWRTMDESLASAYAGWAWLSALFLIAGGLALFLSAIGLYGVMAFQVAQRTREIGVRMALGGGRANVLAVVLRQGMSRIVAGLVGGALFAVPLAWLMRVLLLDVQPLDPFVFTAVPAVLLAAGWLGCLVPALRATRVDPQAALGAD